jgi:hypothetical protein
VHTEQVTVTATQLVVLRLMGRVGVVQCSVPAHIFDALDVAARTCVLFMIVCIELKCSSNVYYNNSVPFVHLCQRIDGTRRARGCGESIHKQTGTAKAEVDCNETEVN